MTKNVSILGSTGSIGTQALDVVRKRGFNVTALCVHNNVELLEKQAREFQPKLVAVFDESKSKPGMTVCVLVLPRQSAIPF